MRREKEDFLPEALHPQVTARGIQPSQPTTNTLQCASSLGVVPPDRPSTDTVILLPAT